MGVLELTQQNIEETINNNNMVFIDFWAPWCGPCRNFAPIYEKVAEKNPDVKFTKLNTDDQQEIAAQFGIQSIPTVGVFKEKELIFLQPGLMPEDILTEVVQKVREINMDDVRKEIEKEQK